MFFKEKIVYTDILQEYRDIPVWDFHMFDKVIVISVTGYSFEEVYKWYRWVVVWYDEESMNYRIVFQDWNCQRLKAKLKKDYWEFQEEFEALEESEKLSKEIKTKLERLEELKKKTDKLKDKNMSFFNQN